MFGGGVRHSLQGFVKLDSGCRVEHNGDVGRQLIEVGLGYAQTWDSDVALNGHQFVKRFRVLISYLLKDLFRIIRISQKNWTKS